MTNPGQGSGDNYESTDIPEPVNGALMPEHVMQQYDHDTKPDSMTPKEPATIEKPNISPTNDHNNDVGKIQFNAKGTTKLWRKDKGNKDQKAPYAIAGFIDNDGRVYYLSDKDYADVASGAKKLEDVMENYTTKK